MFIYQEFEAYIRKNVKALFLSSRIKLLSCIRSATHKYKQGNLSTYCLAHFVSKQNFLSLNDFPCYLNEAKANDMLHIFYVFGVVNVAEP